MSLLAAAFFLSARFSFSDLPDFLLLDWRGDLSATAGSSGSRGGAPRSVSACWSRAEPGLSQDLEVTVLGPETPRNGFMSTRVTHTPQPHREALLSTGVTHSMPR
jgi:hypothetical protein